MATRTREREREREKETERREDGLGWWVAVSPLLPPEAHTTFKGGRDIDWAGKVDDFLTRLQAHATAGRGEPVPCRFRPTPCPD